MRHRGVLLGAPVVLLLGLAPPAAASGAGFEAASPGGAPASGAAQPVATRMLAVGPTSPSDPGSSGRVAHLAVRHVTVCSAVPAGATTVSIPPPATGPNPALPIYPAPLPAVTTAAVGTSSVLNAYDLVVSNGSVHNFGGASFFGSAVHERLRASIVTAVATPDGGGYWLAGAKGSVYNYGDAGFFGSAVHARLRKPVVAIAPTPDGKGYWLAVESGALYNYGDAPFCGSAVHAHLSSPVVAMAPTPDGRGYWLVSRAGKVLAFGDALSVATTPRPLPAPVVSMAPTPDGGGYWLVTSKGNLYPFGDAGFFGSPVHAHFKRPVASITSSADGKGYWVTTATGQVFNYGDAPFGGSLVHAGIGRRARVAGLILQPVPAPPSPTVTPLGPAPWPHALYGFDISNYQCSTSNPTAASSTLPATSGATIIEVAGWLDSSSNPCLAAQAAYAVQAAGTTGAHYSLYLFLNSPGTSTVATAQAAAGPGGTCATLAASLQAACAAYNYGYNGAHQAYAYAAAAGVSSTVWWLDIENDTLSATNNSNFPTSYWSGSTTLNDETIEGALDALRATGATVGLYGTSVQYLTIAGSFTPASPQLPLWVAGVPWTNPPFTEAGLPAPSILAAWCAGTATYGAGPWTAAYAGGVVWMLQETPGSEPSPAGLDPNYVC